MKLLNVGCGSVRPWGPWTNLDDLQSQLKPGTPERENLDKEINYINHKLPDPMPFLDDCFDGLLISHVIEHFTCHDAAHILFDCKRVLKPGGLLVVSVPDAEYFLKVHSQDTPERAVELFGEPICPDEPWHKSFFDYALWYNQHKQLIDHDVLLAILWKAGFDRHRIQQVSPQLQTGKVVISPVFEEIEKIMNRRKFSLEMCAVK